MDAIIAGVDEAGRGPLAGPVCIAQLEPCQTVHIRSVSHRNQTSKT